MSNPYEGSKRLTDLLALSHVPRWGIVEHSRSQSVADHTFRVLVIALEIASRLGVPFGRNAIMFTLQHDADESRTGDIPTPAKRAYHLDIDSAVACPWIDGESDEKPSVQEMSIFLLADMIEAYTFIRRHGTGSHAARVVNDMHREVFTLIGHFDAGDVSGVRAMVIRGVIQDILDDTGR